MAEHEHSGISFTSLVLRGKNLVPQEVVDAIGIKPSKSFKRGDIRVGTKKWPHGYWELSSKGAVQSSDLQVHLEWLIEQLEPIKTQLTKIIHQEGIDASLSCFWIMPTTHESLSLSGSLLIQIASLDLKLDLDIYCP